MSSRIIIENVSSMILEFFVIQGGKDIRVNIKPGESTWCDCDSSTKSMILYERKNLIKIKNDFEEKIIVDITIVPNKKAEFIDLDFKVVPTGTLNSDEETELDEDEEDYEDEYDFDDYEEDDEDEEEEEEQGNTSSEGPMSPVEEAKKDAEEYKKDSEKKYKGKKRGRKKKRGPKPGSKRKKASQLPTIIDKKDDTTTTGFTSQ